MGQGRQFITWRREPATIVSNSPSHGWRRLFGLTVCMPYPMNSYGMDGQLVSGMNHEGHASAANAPNSSLNCSPSWQSICRPSHIDDTIGFFLVDSKESDWRRTSERPHHKTFADGEYFKVIHTDGKYDYIVFSPTALYLADKMIALQTNLTNLTNLDVRYDETNHKSLFDALWEDSSKLFKCHVPTEGNTRNLEGLLQESEYFDPSQLEFFQIPENCMNVVLFCCLLYTRRLFKKQEFPIVRYTKTYRFDQEKLEGEWEVSDVIVYLDHKDSHIAHVHSLDIIQILDNAFNRVWAKIRLPHGGKPPGQIDDKIKNRSKSLTKTIELVNKWIPDKWREITNAGYAVPSHTENLKLLDISKSFATADSKYIDEVCRYNRGSIHSLLETVNKLNQLRIWAGQGEVVLDADSILRYEPNLSIAEKLEVKFWIGFIKFTLSKLLIGDDTRESQDVDFISNVSEFPLSDMNSSQPMSSISFSPTEQDEIMLQEQGSNTEISQLTSDLVSNATTRSKFVAHHSSREVETTRTRYQPYQLVHNSKGVSGRVAKPSSSNSFTYMSPVPNYATNLSQPVSQPIGQSESVVPALTQLHFPPTSYTSTSWQPTQVPADFSGVKNFGPTYNLGPPPTIAPPSELPHYNSEVCPLEPRQNYDRDSLPSGEVSTEIGFVSPPLTVSDNGDSDQQDYLDRMNLTPSLNTFRTSVPRMADGEDSHNQRQTAYSHTFAPP